MTEQARFIFLRYLSYIWKDTKLCTDGRNIKKQFSWNGSVKDMFKKANITPGIQLRDVTTVILDPNRVSLKPKYPTQGFVHFRKCIYSQISNDLGIKHNFLYTYRYLLHVVSVSTVHDSCNSIITIIQHSVHNNLSSNLNLPHSLGKPVCTRWCCTSAYSTW